MTNQTMPRSEWVLSQLLTWQNVVSSIAIFFNTGRDTYVMLAGSVPGALQPVFSARRHLILTLMAVYMGTGILISTVIYFIYR